MAQRFSLDERERVEVMITAGVSVAEAARRLERDPSTIHRELALNRGGGSGAPAQDAQARRRRRSGRDGRRVARAQDVTARDQCSGRRRGRQHRRGDDLSGLL